MQIDLSWWRPISHDAPVSHLNKAFRWLLRYHEWAADYVYDTERLNDLLTWTSYTEPWPLHAFTYQYGLGKGEASQPHTIAEAAQYMKRPKGTVAAALAPNTQRMHLVRAHHVVRDAPLEAQGPNELREAGLSVGTWYALAVFGKIFTLKQLSQLTPAQAAGIYRIGPDRYDELSSFMLFYRFWQ